MFDMYLRNCKVNIDILLNANYGKRLLNNLKANGVPEFYIKILQAWRDIVEPSYPKELYLWYNEMLCIQGKPVFYKSFHEVNINTVHDVYNENGTVRPFQVH